MYCDLTLNSSLLVPTEKDLKTRRLMPRRTPRIPRRAIRREERPAIRRERSKSNKRTVLSSLPEKCVCLRL